MQSTCNDIAKVVEINGRSPIYSVFFAEDGKHILSGGDEGVIRRWPVDGGPEIGEAIRAGNRIFSLAASPDHKWLACGVSAHPCATVWDAHTRGKLKDFGGHRGAVWSVDIASNSTKLATGGSDGLAFIWNMVTGERLVGPLQHNSSSVVTVRFSPKCDRLATAAAQKSIKIFDSENGQQIHDIPCKFHGNLSSPLAWSADGCKLFAISFNDVKCFDMPSGSLLTKWSVPGDTSSSPSSIVVSRNHNFVAVTAGQSLSFWDASTQKQLGPVIEHKSTVWSITLSPNEDWIATGDSNGTITLRSLRDNILTASYFEVDVMSQLPLVNVGNAVFKSWSQGDLTSVEQLLTEDILHPLNSAHHARALAYRSIIRSRLKQYNKAIDDAKKSIEVQRSVVGYVATAIARAGNGELDFAMRAFDLVFASGLSTESNLLLLIKAIILFEFGRHDDALSRIEDLIDIMDDKSMYFAVRVQMRLLLGDLLLKQGDYERAIEFLGLMREEIPPAGCSQLTVISLMFGWNFDDLALSIHRHLQQCIKILEDLGDTEVQSKNPGEAVSRYSMALSLNPSNLARLLVKRSKARGMLSFWEDALQDADEAIKVDPQGRWGYERRHIALYALKRYDEAVDALNRLRSLTEEPLDQDAHCACHRGEDAAFDHLLEDIFSRSGEATVLSWTGQSSPYNSCLPASLSICDQPPHALPSIQDAEMDARTVVLRRSVSPADAMLIYDRITRLPPPRFINRRLYLPCIMFPVKKLVLNEAGDDEEKWYCARTSGIGQVEFQTTIGLSLTEPRKLVFVYPWMRDLRDPQDGLGSGSVSDTDVSESDSEAEIDTAPAVSPLYGVPVATTDDYTRGLRLIVRLQQPFRALLLQQQPSGEFQRVAAEHEIVVPGLDRRIGSAKDIRTEVLEIS